MDGELTIPSRAQQCIILFEKLPRPINDMWAGEQLARFKIWAFNMGMFALGHESFDYRLGPGGCHDRRAYRLISRFVAVIFESLKLAVRACDEPNQLNDLLSSYRCVEQHYPYADDSEYRQPDWKIHDPSDVCEQTPQEDVIQDVTLGYELEHPFTVVENSIDRLNEIALSVRTAGLRYREERAYRFKDIVEIPVFGNHGDGDVDSDATPPPELEEQPSKKCDKRGSRLGEDLNEAETSEESIEEDEHVETADGEPEEKPEERLSRLQAPEGELRMPTSRISGKQMQYISYNITKRFRAMITARIQYMFPDAEEWLRDRVANAVALRRNYLAYLAHEHHKVLTAGQHDSDSESDSDEEFLETESVSSESLSLGDDSPGSPVYVAEATKSLSKAKSIASTMSFDWNKDRLRIPPPKPLSESRFLCPYCHVLCHTDDLKERRWEKHLKADLQPYVCLHETCKTPNATYSSFHEWVFHMRLEHSPREWVCSSDAHEIEIFADEQAYIRHVKSFHYPKARSSQLKALARTNSRQIGNIFVACPFSCEDNEAQNVSPLADSLEGKQSREKIPGAPALDLRKHVGRHLQIFAKLSLDWLNTAHEGDASDGEEYFSDPESVLSSSSADAQFSEVRLPSPDIENLDPTWASWKAQNESRMTGSREEEWALQKNERYLPLYYDRGRGPDAVILMFKLEFDKLSEGHQRNHILLPPTADDLVFQPPSTNMVTGRVGASRGSDDGEERRIRRLDEARDQVVGILNDYEQTYDQHFGQRQPSVVAEKTPLLESPPNKLLHPEQATGLPVTFSDKTDDNKKPLLARNDSTPEAKSAEVKIQPKRDAHQSTSSKTDMSTVDFIENSLPNYHPAFANPITQYDPQTQRYVPSIQPKVDITSFGRTEEGKALLDNLRESLKHVHDLLAKQVAITRGARMSDILPVEANTPRSVLKDLQQYEEQTKSRKKTFYGKRVTQSQAKVKQLFDDESSLAGWKGVLPNELFRGSISTLSAGFKFILRSTSLNNKEAIQEVLIDIIPTALFLGFHPKLICTVNTVELGVGIWETVFSIISNLIKLTSQSPFLQPRAIQLDGLPERLMELRGRFDSQITADTHEVLQSTTQNLKVTDSLSSYSLNLIKTLLEESSASKAYALKLSQRLMHDAASADSHNVTRSLSDALAYLSCDGELKSTKADMSKIMRQALRLTPEEQELCSSVCRAVELRTWFEQGSSILFINGQLTSLRRRSFMTSVSAELAKQIAQCGHSVLTFFAGEHVDATPARAVRSMLVTALKAHPDIANTVLDNIKEARQDDVWSLLNILRILIKSMSPNHVIFFILDGLTFYTDKQRIGDVSMLVEFLTRLPSDTTLKCTVKVLISAPTLSAFRLLVGNLVPPPKMQLLSVRSGQYLPAWGKGRWIRQRYF